MNTYLVFAGGCWSPRRHYGKESRLWYQLPTCDIGLSWTSTAVTYSSEKFISLYSDSVVTNNNNNYISFQVLHITLHITLLVLLHYALYLYDININTVIICNCIVWHTKFISVGTCDNIMLQNEEVCGNTIYSSSEASGVNHIIHRSRRLRWIMICFQLGLRPRWKHGITMHFWVM